MSNPGQPCGHENNHGVHGQVVCLFCGTVVRQMTAAERAADTTFRDVVDPWAAGKVKDLICDQTKGKA